jgi:hypothetical protein
MEDELQVRLFVARGREVYVANNFHYVLATSPAWGEYLLLRCRNKTCHARLFVKIVDVEDMTEGYHVIVLDDCHNHGQMASEPFRMHQVN